MDRRTTEKGNPPARALNTGGFGENSSASEAHAHRLRRCKGGRCHVHPADARFCSWCRCIEIGQAFVLVHQLSIMEHNVHIFPVVEGVCDKSFVDLLFGIRDLFYFSPLRFERYCYRPWCVPPQPQDERAFGTIFEDVISLCLKDAREQQPDYEPS